MNITRRDVLRRIAGLATAASIWASTVFVLDDDIPSVVAGRQASNNGRGNSGTAPGRLRQSTSSTSSASTSSASTETSQPTTHHHDETSTTEQPTSTTADADVTSTTVGDKDNPPATNNAILTGALGEHTVPEGQIHRLVGSVSFSGPLRVLGTLTCDSSGVEVDMKGNAIEVRAGGRILLEGRAKTGWARWGESVSGWISGDRLAIAPTEKGHLSPLEGTWSGSWGGPPSTAQPVTLIDGRVMQPEATNLTRSVTIRNAARLMVHESSRVVQHRIRYVSFKSCGAESLGFYPIHFHLNGNNTRGSVVEGVVVEGSPNRAFVAHGSHGVTFKDCVAYNVRRGAYWWDRGSENQSHDIQYLHCIALGIRPGASSPTEHVRLAGFVVNAARNRDGGSKVIDCAAACVDATAGSGFLWNQNESADPWTFRNNVAHNNRPHGIFVWQNTSNKHLVEDTVLYNNSGEAISHGAYLNPYTYRRLVIQGSGTAVLQLANARPDGILFEEINTNGSLVIGEHNLAPHLATVHRRCRYDRVIIDEPPKSESGSWTRFEDCGLTQTSFEFRQVRTDTRVEIVEGGQLVSTWVSNSWS